MATLTSKMVPKRYKLKGKELQKSRSSPRFQTNLSELMKSSPDRQPSRIDEYAIKEEDCADFQMEVKHGVIEEVQPNEKSSLSASIVTKSSGNCETKLQNAENTGPSVPIHTQRIILQMSGTMKSGIQSEGNKSAGAILQRPKRIPRVGAMHPPHMQAEEPSETHQSIPPRAPHSAPPRAPPLGKKKPEPNIKSKKQQVQTKRDPLLHSSLVTPPCPIQPLDYITPEAYRQYSHKPDLPDYLIPKMGMVFENFEAAQDFYNRYARHAGFGTRIGQQSGFNKYLYCTRQGKYESTVSDGERQRDKTTKRCDCKAKLRLKGNKYDGTCILADMNLVHNHQLIQSPSMLVFLHSHKFFDKTILDYVKFLQFQNVPHHTIMSILYGSLGGGQFLAMHGRDLLNKKAINSKIDNVDDVKKLLSFFAEMKAVNKEFFFDFQIDEFGRIKNIFWANASCRGAYQDFGDCMTFDTTYRTNQYLMPLGVFVGVNNHLQSTIFACALIRDESEESFAWIFRTFLKCMNDKQPTIILTDQCPSMTPAIAEIFFLALHKLCRWHITNKYTLHLSNQYKRYPTFKREFQAIINWPLMPTEFEAAWQVLLDKYNLHNDHMMLHMWADRKEWISAYFKDVFCARMTSTQRSESMNYILKKGYINQEKNLHRFAEQVNNCIFTRRQIQNSQTLASMTEPITRTYYGFEKQFSEHYTKAVFKEFRSKLKKSTLFRIKQNPDPNLDQHNYLVTYHEPTDLFSWSNHEFKVVANPLKGEYSCECKLFEHTGLFCLHVICLLEHLRVDSVPDYYILKRYTKKAKTKETFDRKDYKSVSFDGTSFLYQQNENLQLAMKIVRTATKSDEHSATAKEGMEELLKKLEEMGSSTATDDNTCNPPDLQEFEADLTTETNETAIGNGEQTQVEQKNESDGLDILPPPMSKTKGTRNKKTTGSKPAAATKKKKIEEEPELDKDGNPVTGRRRCGKCGKKQGHNSRRCPNEEKTADETADGKPSKKVRKICKGCNEIATGHNILTCPVIRDALAIARSIGKGKKQVNKKNKRKIESDEDDEDEEDENDEDEDDEQTENDGEEEDEEEDASEEEQTPPPATKKRRTTNSTTTAKSKKLKVEPQEMRRSSRLK